MNLLLRKTNIYFPNTFANLLVILASLGVSIFTSIRNVFFIVTIVLIATFGPRIKLNGFTPSTYLLSVLNVYFLVGSVVFHDPSSTYLFKDFIYLLVFDLILKNRMRFSKSVFNITIFFSILTLVLNLTYRANIIGAYSPAFGIPRVLNVSILVLPVFLLFHYVSNFQRLFIVFGTLITFSAGSYVLLLIYFLRRFPLLLLTAFMLLVLNFNFEDNELYSAVKMQKEKSIENKINDSRTVKGSNDEYEAAEILSVELYLHSGIVFSLCVTFFLVYYIYMVSGNWMFTLFSMILVSSNPMPISLLLIIGSCLKLSKYENKKHSRSRATGY